MHYSKRIFLTTFTKKTSSKPIHISHTKSKFGPLVWKCVGRFTPKQSKPLFCDMNHFVKKSERSVN